MVQNLKEYIIKTKKKSGNNSLCYCKACFVKFGEDEAHPELKTIVDKTERILTHFKNCQNFQDMYSQEEKIKIFSLGAKKNNANLGKQNKST
jgi:hypothetical protein